MKRNALAVGMFAVVGAALVSAQEIGPDPHPDASPPTAEAAHPLEFGVQDEAITVIGYERFSPPSGGEFETDLVIGTRWPTSQPFLLAPLDTLPHGSLLTQIVFYFRDTDPTWDFEASLCRYWVDSATGANSDWDCPVDLASSGSPGDTYFQAFPNLPILYRHDVDGDGDIEVVHYVLHVITPGNDGRIRIRFVRLLWKRQVSPAPDVASFGDVATDHPFYQHIEALFAAGITAGCGGGNYCPNRAITRGEMAVFLAKALGLHWPWDAP